MKPISKDKLPSVEYVRSRLAYDAASGVLTWLPREELTRLDAMWNAAFAGTEAGSVNGFGYRRIGIGGVNIMAHRIAWAHHHGFWPDGSIDHADRVRTNNMIGNLRLADKSSNGANKSMHRNNTSGHKGVSWHKRRAMWHANIPRQWCCEVSWIFR